MTWHSLSITISVFGPEWGEDTARTTLPLWLSQPQHTITRVDIIVWIVRRQLCSKSRDVSLGKVLLDYFVSVLSQLRLLLWCCPIKYISRIDADNLIPAPAGTILRSHLTLTWSSCKIWQQNMCSLSPCKWTIAPPPSYHDISCHIMLYNVISCHVMAYHVISCLIMSYHAILCHIMSYYVLLCHIISHIILCHIMSYHVMSCHILKM